MKHRFKVIKGSFYDGKRKRYQADTPNNVVMSEKRLDKSFPNKFQILSPRGRVMDPAEVPDPEQEFEKEEEAKMELLDHGRGWYSVINPKTGEPINSRKMHLADAMALIGVDSEDEPAEDEIDDGE